MTKLPTVGALRKREEREKYKVYPKVWSTEEDIKEAKFQKRQSKIEEEKKAGTYEAKRDKINASSKIYYQCLRHIIVGALRKREERREMYKVYQIVWPTEESITFLLHTVKQILNLL